ncbi:MAG: phosphate ABC transporter substrate-binding protein [Thermogemmatispora sp.]|jgi:phosphate transport system substrate-binding protein|uniref:phosphate ABC transporter substrate-binding protein n=1 Tax=Thermogemmatispora TaxID=768669 RepID=UPI00124DA055|nr:MULTISPECIES: phosphate ABC transporter substrate-binding protein [Thermogemmatispora]MBE3566377.1 phosphate ABC transporter substrate-binding protein [Thermogemmatispora sp.]
MVSRKKRREINTVLIGLGLIVLILLAGCGEVADSQSVLSGRLHIAGSTALQPLVSAAASLFERQHPQVHIQVDGGGSRAGLAAVTSHQADIGDSDIYADPAIYPDPNLTDHIVCVIPFAMVVNPDVTVTSLTRQQIIDIFSTGSIRNWSQVGGPDLPIVPVVRPQTSGTRDTFRKYILGGRDEKGKLLQTDSSVTVRETVAHTPGAIGYLGLSVLTPAVRVLAIEGARPTLTDIVAGRYIFWSYEHMYTLGDDNPLLSAFLDFMLSAPVQQKAQEMGYIPIAAMNLNGSSREGASVLSLAMVTRPEQDRAFSRGEEG